MKIKLLRGLCVVICFLLTLSTFAQQRVLVGNVKDDKGNIVAGATVKVKGSAIGTSTDDKGLFKLTVPESAKTLQISYVGMASQEVAIGKQSFFAVDLVTSNSQLQDVVVIGYGTAKRANVTSAISSVKAKDLKDIPATGIDQALQGKVAGVTITNNSGQPGGGVAIRVRGITSINSNDPLIVIDGVPMTSNTISNSGYAGLGGSDGQTGNSVMATLNPNDIESVDILKDASAQAIYGSQAANGVILITTKKGKKGEGKVSYDFYYGQSQVTKKLDLMDLRQFAEYQNSVVKDAGLDSTAEFKDPSVLGRGTDWQDAIFQNGHIQSHQISFSGGTDKSNYYISLGYFDQKGILIGSDFKRYSARFNVDNQIKSWMKVGMSTNISRSNQNVTLADAAEGTIWWSAIQSPLIPVKNLDGTWGGAGQAVGGITYNQDNPVARASMRGNTTISNNIFGNVYADIMPLSWLSLKNEVSFSIGNQNNDAFSNAGVIGSQTLRSQLSQYRGNSYYYNLRNYFTANKTFGKHTINGTLGHEAQYSHYEGISGKKLDLVNNIMDLNAGNTDKTTWEMNGGKGEWAMESYFARANYTFDNRYSVSASIRADGSSYFAPKNRWGYFPAASFGWTITNEKFAANWDKTVSALKLRVGYGAVGNQNPPSVNGNLYVAGVQLWPGPVGFGTSNSLNGIPNPNVTWESVVSANVGVDGSFFKNRMDVSVDLYKKTTKNMLMFTNGASYLGIGDQWDDLKAPIGNAGTMTNTGVDLSISGLIISKHDLTWKATGIFSSFKNKLVEMPNPTSAYDGKVYYNNYTLTHTKVGEAVGSFYGLVTDGLFRTQKELDASLPQFGYPVDKDHTWLGDIRFKDINGDGKINESDFTKIGSPYPKFTYGLTNTVNYKNFDFSVFVQGSYGAKIYNFLRWQTEKMDNAYNNQTTAVLDRYTAANTNGKLPRFTRLNVNNVYVSDRYIEDGSYLRIQNISLGYRLPKNIFGKTFFSNARFYVSVQNLKTFTKYSGFDPEIGSFNNSIRLQNVDAGHYPNPRTFTIGANFEF